MKAIPLIVAAVTASLLSSAPANADAQSFLDAVAPMGYTDRNGTLRDGYTVCVLRTAADADLTSRAIRKFLIKAGQDLDAVNSEQFTALAVANLCPEFTQ